MERLTLLSRAYWRHCNDLPIDQFHPRIFVQQIDFPHTMVFRHGPAMTRPKIQ